MVFHLSPLTNKVLPTLKAERATMTVKGDLPPSVLADYDWLIQKIEEGETLLSLRVLALVKAEEKTLLPPHLPHSGSLVGVFFPVWGRIGGAFPKGVFTQDAILPTHIGEGLLSLPAGRTVDGMIAQIDFGGPTSAKHVAIYGRTRTGKSTLAKYLVFLAISRVPEVRVIAYDLKGEYALPTENGYEGLFGGRVVRGSGIHPGEMTLSAPPAYFAQVAEYEAYLVNEVLRTLEYPTIPGLETVFKRAYEYKKSGKSAQAILQGIREKICRDANIAPNTIPESVLFSPKTERVENAPGVWIVDLSGAPYGSPAQVAQFRWSVGTIVPLTGDLRIPRTFLLLEEAHLLGGEISTLLRTAGGRGVSIILVTQSPQDTQYVIGAAEQFSTVVYTCPGKEQVLSVARDVFGSDDEEFFPPAQRDALFSLRGLPYGWGCQIMPSGCVVCEYPIPKDILARIQVFNARAQAQSDTYQDEI